MHQPLIVDLCAGGSHYSLFVGGSSKIQTLCPHDSSSIEIEVYSNGKTVRLLKSVFFIYKGAGILQTCIYYPEGVSHTHFNWHVIL